MLSFRNVLTRSAKALRGAATTSALTLALFPLAASAGSSSAAFNVGLTILPPGGMGAESSPTELEVSATDIARGYVEAHRATRLTITTAGEAGYVLDVSPATAVFTEVLVEGVGRQVTLGANGGTIYERGAVGVSPPHALVLDFRFTLAPGMTPGRYPWPLRSIRVRPLAST